MLRKERWSKMTRAAKIRAEACQKRLSLAASGENNSGAKLRECDIVEIRELYAMWNVSHRELALTYNVNANTIGSIIRRQTWKHLP